MSPSESKNRPSAPEVIQQLGGKMIADENEGPLYIAEIELSFSGQMRRLGFIAQNHKMQMEFGLQFTIARPQKRYVSLLLTVSRW